MADPMTTADSGTKTDKPVINARLGRLLGVVFLLFSLLVVNSVYLSAITLLEQSSNEIYQDYFYLLMFFAHLVLGLLLTVPVIIFAIGHMRRAWSRPNRYAIRAGIALFTGLMLVLLTGLLLTRFSFLEINDPLIRRISYWIHIVSPFAVAWLFVLHRLAGPPIRWRGAVRWSFVAAGFAAVMILVHVGIRIRGGEELMTKFPPSLAVLQGSETIPPEHLMTDGECKECHADIAASHETSMHHFSSFTNPPYKFSVKETRDVVYKRDDSMQASRFCAACHDPVPLFSGRFDDPAYDMDNDPTAKAGITCATCHAITRVNSVRGNGDYTIVDPPSYPFAYSKSGLLKAINHQLIRAKPEFHKKTLLQPFHRSAEFCSLCHKVHIPKEVNDYRWLRGQDHYDSFLFSGVSGHRVDSFYYPEHAVDRCSHCHMALQQVHRLWRHRGDYGGNLLSVVDPRGVQAVGAGFRIRNQPPDRLVDVGASAHESFGAAGQHDTGATLVDRRSRGPDTRHRQSKVMERTSRVARRVFDREPSDPGGRSELDVRGDVLRIDREAALEIRIHRHLHRGHDLMEVLERLIERDLIVRAAQRPGEAGTGRR